MTSEADEIEPPGLSSWLLSFLSARRKEYEEQYDLDSPDEGKLNEALRVMARRAESLVTSGVLDQELADGLEAFMPGDPDGVKVRQLLAYQIVQHRLEFDIAESVCFRLEGLNDRVGEIAVFTALLLGYHPSPTALKYFRRATTLFLAGYETEAIIMCGAVLEAALAHRFPDEALESAGVRPLFKNGDYSVGQRLKFERDHPVLSPEERTMIGQLISWRNDAVHVQPDLGPQARKALISLVLVLPTLLPVETRE